MSDKTPIIKGKADRERYSIVPPNWVPFDFGHGHAGVFFGSIFGDIRVHSVKNDEPDEFHPEFQYHWSYCFDEYYDEGKEDCDSVEDGKAKAEAFYLSRLMPALALCGPAQGEVMVAEASNYAVDRGEDHRRIAHYADQIAKLDAALAAGQPRDAAGGEA